MNAKDTRDVVWDAIARYVYSKGCYGLYPHVTPRVAIVTVSSNTGQNLYINCRIIIIIMTVIIIRTVITRRH